MHCLLLEEDQYYETIYIITFGFVLAFSRFLQFQLYSVIEVRVSSHTLITLNRFLSTWRWEQNKEMGLEVRRGLVSIPCCVMYTDPPSP